VNLWVEKSQFDVDLSNSSIPYFSLCSTSLFFTLCACSSFLPFWFNRFNVLDIFLVILDVSIITLEFAFANDQAKSGSSAKALRSVRIFRAFRSARGSRTLRAMKFARFARVSRYFRKWYLMLLFELDAKAQKLDSAEPLIGFVEIAW
jgi:hypothetical protein